MDSYGPSREVEKPKNRTQRHATLRQDAEKVKASLSTVRAGLKLFVQPDSDATVTLAHASTLIDRLVAELK